MPESNPAVLDDPALAIDLVPVLITKAVRLIAPRPLPEVTGEHRLIDDLGFHSLALAELSFGLEDLFRLDAIAPERAMSLQTVGDIVALILQVLAEEQGELPRVSDVESFCGQYGAVWDPTV